MFRKPLSLMLLLGAPILFGACGDSEEEPQPEPAALIIDREAVDYGELEVGQASAEQRFVVRNASPSAVESVTVSIDGTGFAIMANTCERYLDAGMECEVQVKFAPRLAGTYEARLKVQGAPSVDQAVLKGVAFGWVDVTSMPAGVKVVAGDGEWTCSEPCRKAVRKAEIILHTAPEGFPSWGGPCEAAPNNGCLLRMDGPKAVFVRSVTPLFQWEVRRDLEPMSLVVAPNGDILVQDFSNLTRLSSTGQVLWTRSVTSAAKLVVDGEGRVYVMSYSGRVSRLGADGQELWGYLPTGNLLNGHFLGVSTGGHLYVMVDLGSLDGPRQARLVALTPDGTERWSVAFDEGTHNYPYGMGVDASGAVYVSGGVYNQNATTGESVFVKGYLRKFNSEGTRLWETTSAFYGFTTSSWGELTSTSSSANDPPGGFAVYWIGTNGNPVWSTPYSQGPGMVSAQAFSSAGSLLLGGYESLTGGAVGRGWFAPFNTQTRVLGPVTYVDASFSKGTRVSSLAFTPAGNVVVGGGPGDSSLSGFVRLYDARILSGQ
ncbi:PQQ-binding-like beta-propeller repeat protein [Pyxidicoccus parkwayensis]|uniref:PQQ-binding-like beta-propeller repeat protein n=1 Tax=Pyxidicoccus parkwayensis TaxID=2813578 RepID=A0ABX7P0Q4_9BACT|nr:PQQ-binding-like beta-propeller repeat protein [Pyxidicoccus parkwaysis]QSQ21893.1 PQQ-binding-like beta-propeller repeat protein [Pyxidicoccus parkwaysis]